MFVSKVVPDGSMWEIQMLEIESYRLAAEVAVFLVALVVHLEFESFGSDLW